jgi:hypothetical protein
MNILLDTDEELQCENCERPIEPGEPKIILGFNVPEGENWIMPYCQKCGDKLLS